MNITGKIIRVYPVVEGVSKAGNEWRKQEYVLKYLSGQYEKCLIFAVMGEKIEQFNIQDGGVYDVYFDIDAREYNGKWYNSVNVWKVAQPQNESPQSPTPAGAPAPVQQTIPLASTDELPF